MPYKKQQQRNEQQFNALAGEMKIDLAKQDIVKYREQLHLEDPRGYEGHVGLYHRTVWMGNLAEAYKTIGDIDNMKKCCYDLIRYANEHKSEMPGAGKANPTATEKKYSTAILKHFKKAHFLLAPHSFHHYLLAMEWNYRPNQKFYTNRFCVLGQWAKELENLEFGKYEILGLSAPPRTGKTFIGTLFVTWLMGRHPEKSIFFASHSNSVAEKVYNDISLLLTDPRREWSQIFPGLSIVDKSAEYKYIDIGPKDDPSTYKTFYARGIDSDMAGVLEASHLIYCDDLIKNITEACNPARLDNAWQKYGTDISQRRTDDDVKELHIATRWSVRDVLSTLESENQHNPNSKFIKIPGLNEQGESNFMFKYKPMTANHFLKLRTKMDEVSWECIVQQNPIERDGLVFQQSSLSYYEGELPQTEPDEIVFAGDIAFGGGDFLCIPIGYIYGHDAYIHDVVHSDKTKETTKPLVVSKLIEHKCQRGYMEANNGGQEYSADIDTRLREQGFRCHIESRKAPTNKAKLSRILDAQSEIKALITDGSGYNLHFRSPKARKNMLMYELYMKHLTEFNQSAGSIGKQKDDAADATAMLVNEVLNRKNISGKVTFLSRKSLAI